MGKPFLYRCPIMRLNVQGMTTDEPDAASDRKDRRIMVRCLACGGVHLVDPAEAPKPPPEPE